MFSFTTCQNIPPEAKLLSRGLDFGFSNDPTVMVETYVHEQKMYVKELLYRTGMTNQDIGNKLQALGLDRRDEIFCDSAEPKSIEEIHRMGWNTKPTFKGAINIGIDMIRRYQLIVTEDSINLIKELRNYKYIEDKTATSLISRLMLSTIVAMLWRYSIVNKLARPNYGKYFVKISCIINKC